MPSPQSGTRHRKPALRGLRGGEGTLQVIRRMQLPGCVFHAEDASFWFLLSRLLFRRSWSCERLRPQNLHPRFIKPANRAGHSLLGGGAYRSLVTSPFRFPFQLPFQRARANCCAALQSQSPRAELIRSPGGTTAKAEFTLRQRLFRCHPGWVDPERSRLPNMLRDTPRLTTVVFTYHPPRHSVHTSQRERDSHGP